MYGSRRLLANNRVLWRFGCNRFQMTIGFVATQTFIAASFAYLSIPHHRGVNSCCPAYRWWHSLHYRGQYGPIHSAPYAERFNLWVAMQTIMPYDINSSYWMLMALTSIVFVVMYSFMYAAAIKPRYNHPEVQRVFLIPEREGRNMACWRMGLSVNGLFRLLCP
jgi:hypothetical protein